LEEKPFMTAANDAMITVPENREWQQG